MTGMLIAVVFLALSVSALAYALLAPKRVEQPKEAQPKRKRHAEEFVTRDELDEAIAEATKEMTFEWNEWYEKFDKLHMRLSKREKRKQVNPDQEELEPLGDRPSVLNFRRIGSV
jgi:hypothetical protein